MNDDSVLTEFEAAELLKCDVRDVKRAWKRGLLRGARFRGGLRFRVGAVRAFMIEEEERWHASNSAARGSAKSPADPPSTSIGTTPSDDGSADAELALTIADGLKKPSASSSSNVRELRSRANASRRNDTP